MYRDILEECHLACLYVNFHDGNMCRVSHDRVEGSQVLTILAWHGGKWMVVGKGALQAALHIRGQVQLKPVGLHSDIRDTQRGARLAFDRDASLTQFQVVRICL